MKFNKFLSYALILAASFTFISCDDDDDDNGGGSNPTFDSNVLPVSIESTDEDNDVDLITFKYDESDTKRIVGYTVISKYDNIADTTEYVITYNANGLITKLDEVFKNYSNYYTYEYAAARSTGTTNMMITRKRNGENDIYNTAQLLVNSKGLLLEAIYPGYKEKNVYSYASERNNLIKFEEYENDTIDTKVEIGYGEKAGAFRNVSTPQWFLFLELEDRINVPADIDNNCMKAIGEDYKGLDDDKKPIVDTQWTTEFTYQTFIKDFPSLFTSRTKDLESGEILYKTTNKITYNVSE